jgi:hypothetical protein
MAAFGANTGNGTTLLRAVSLLALIAFRVVFIEDYGAPARELLSSIQPSKPVHSRRGG